MLTEDTDVQQAETTAPDSSPANETATEQAAAAPADATATEEAKTDEVPELNRAMERARKAERELAALKAAQEEQSAPADPNADAIKAQLKQMGFVTREEQAQELARREEDARVDRELASLESKYDGRDGRPKFDRTKTLEYAIEHGIGNAEIAYKAMHETQLTDWAVQQAVTKTRGVKTEGSDGSGSSQVGTTTEDLKASIRQGDRSALKTLIRRVTAGE